VGKNKIAALAPASKSAFRQVCIEFTAFHAQEAKKEGMRRRCSPALKVSQPFRPRLCTDMRWQPFALKRAEKCSYNHEMDKNSTQKRRHSENQRGISLYASATKENEKTILLLLVRMSIPLDDIDKFTVSLILALAPFFTVCLAIGNELWTSETVSRQRYLSLPSCFC
jgi:hypothetical protein